MARSHTALPLVLAGIVLAPTLTWAGCVSDDPHTIVAPSGGGGECRSAVDCSGQDTTCRQRACEGGACSNALAAAGTPCSEDGGRMCDGLGSCVECVVHADCVDEALACSAGSCVPVSCMDGVQSGRESAIDCGGPDCPPCGNGSACFEDADCQSHFCQPSGAGGGEPGTCTACSGDADCDPYACDGGTCLATCADDGDCASTSYCVGDTCVPKRPLGAACTAANQCASGFCADGVCCDAACQGGCAACDQPSTGTCTIFAQGAAGDPGCSPFVCNGTSGACPTSCSADVDCAAGRYCNGTTCLAKKSQGASCNAANECLSGNCVDGFCCNTGCINACDACNLGGSQGTCLPRPDGSAGVPPCDPYLCNGNIATCPSFCMTASDCIGGHYCGGSQCLPLKTNGSSCASAVECQSGHCADGYCCDTACAGSCDRCNAMGNLGTCTLLPDGMQGSPSCSPYLCDGASATCPMSCASSADCVSSHYCNGMSQCVPKKTTGSTCGGGAECQSGFCADGYCCNSACGASCDLCNLSGNQGTCLPAPPGSPGNPSCSPYVCDGGGAACPTSCTSNANCAGGFTCNMFSQCV